MLGSGAQVEFLDTNKTLYAAVSQGLLRESVISSEQLGMHSGVTEHITPAEPDNVWKTFATGVLFADGLTVSKGSDTFLF